MRKSTAFAGLFRQTEAGISRFSVFLEKGILLYPISTRTAAAEVRNITASAQSEAGMV